MPSSLECIPENVRTHTFLLGAGASKAACINGDKYGKQLPLMNDLTDALGLRSDFDEIDIDIDGMDFESIYSTLYINGEYQDLIDKINCLIWDYFSSLRLPDEPTVYDHLLLCLRSKDVIASFNWDPFVVQAYHRVGKLFKKPPHFVFLHGSVSIGYCACTKPIPCVEIQRKCPVCNGQLTKAELLFPVGQKDYTSNEFLKSAWQDVRTALNNSYMFTIFGYAAPVSDADAVALLQEGWGTPDEKELEEIEIIDIVDEETLRERWSGFIHSHHYHATNSFYNTFAWRHPRRSCEALWQATMQLAPYGDYTVSPNASWSELEDHFRPLIEAEENAISAK
ncbi:MAG: hypothetical protein ACX94C_10665 [Phycisphaerales bacterium]